MTDRASFLAQVKAQYEAGEVLRVIPTSGSAPHPMDRVFVGDLIDLGLVKRCEQPRGGIAWKLLGEHPILVDDEIVRKGHFL